MVADYEWDLIDKIDELHESLHWMLIQHTREFDGYHEANALSANSGRSVSR